MAHSKESACSARGLGLIPMLGTSPGEGNDYPLQYSCLENSMDREAWGTTVHRVAESRTQLSMHAQCGKRNKLLKLGLFYGKKYFKKTNDPHHSSIDSRQKSSVISGHMNHHEGLRDSSCLSWISHCITGHEQTLIKTLILLLWVWFPDSLVSLLLHFICCWILVPELASCY